MGLNFPWLAANCGGRVEEPEGADTLKTEARLIHVGTGNLTLREFHQRFSAKTRHARESHGESARAAIVSDDRSAALLAFERALRDNPRNWRVIGEAADFVGTHLGDDERALALLDAALALNPWYSSWLWILKGEALARQQRHADAHDCFEMAAHVCPGNARTQLFLAQSWLARARPERSLEAVATGLTYDTESMFRHQLLETQQAAISMLAARAMRDREALARRQSGGLPGAATRV
jgi:tetratricopeptide (TPR) repeat protein